MAADSSVLARLRAHHLFPQRDDLDRLWALAVPVVVVQLGMMLLGVVPVMMVGHVSATHLAAAALGNLYFAWLGLLAWGTLMSLDPLVAQAHGAGDGEGVARAVQRGLVLAVGLSVVTVPLFLPARPVLDAAAASPPTSCRWRPATCRSRPRGCCRSSSSSCCARACRRWGACAPSCSPSWPPTC